MKCFDTAYSPTSDLIEEIFVKNNKVFPMSLFLEEMDK